MAKNYSDYESMGNDLWSLDAEKMFAAAKAYRTEVSRRLAQARKMPALRTTKAYRQLLTESRTSSRELVLTRQRMGETKQQWRNRIMLEVSRAKRYLAAQTSSKAGYMAWRNNTINALANAAGVSRARILKTLQGDKLDEFLRYFEDVKQEVMTYYYMDSDSTFSVAYETFTSPAWRKKPEAERLEYIKEFVYGQFRKQDLAPDSGAQPAQVVRIEPL